MISRIGNNSGYTAILPHLWGNYKGPYGDKVRNIARAFDTATQAEVTLYNNALVEVQQIETMWEEVLRARSILFFRKSQDKIHAESKARREMAENRIGIYLGRLLQLGAEEEELEIFLENILYLEKSLYPQNVLDQFTDGFIERVQTAFVCDRKEALEEYSYSFITGLTPSSEDPNPYNAPQAYDPVSNDPRTNSQFIWIKRLLSFLFL